MAAANGSAPMDWDDVRVFLAVARHGSLRAAAIRAGIGVGLLPCYAGDADPLLERVTPPVTELGAEYWVIVHHDLRHAACVRAVIDWIRRLFDAHLDELAGTDSQPVKARAAE